jgi:hypothetical protein
VSYTVASPGVARALGGVEAVTNSEAFDDDRRRRRRPFPTIDKFSNGVVTSIKSLDTTAATYQGPGKVVK